MEKSGSDIWYSPVDPPRTREPLPLWSEGHRTAFSQGPRVRWRGLYRDESPEARTPTGRRHVDRTPVAALVGPASIGPLPPAGRHNHNSAGRAGGTSALAARVFAGDYTASTATTPATALMAPAICGETLKRPGNFTSTSVPSPSSSTRATSPSALS